MKVNTHAPKALLFILLLMAFVPVHSNLIAQPLRSETPAIPSPAEYLGYELGDKFTLHYKVVGYFQTVAELSDRVTFQTYGETYEGRELVYVIVTSPENHRNIEEIRTNNLKLAGLLTGEPTSNQKAISWLSYNVHGDEASSSEASMMTLYELVSRTDDQVQEWLDRTVIIMDPMINPDGRDRYTAFVTQQTGMKPNPNHDAQEHAQPWPRGRANHYLFDLNRDWAWGMQQETRYRIEAYHKWMPHVHVDYHEQGFDSPYYFAPAAEPYHKVITPWQREFQRTIGTYNMAAFDRKGWIYFTREVFDLFYPSYGDTWPTYNGSIGMTYEQAGGGFAGLSVELPQGNNLTLYDRLLHHHTTGMATIHAVSDHAERVIEEFTTHQKESMTRSRGQYDTYIIKGGQHPDKLTALAKFLETQRIEFREAGVNKVYNAYDYSSGRTVRMQVESGDVLISAIQPKGQLVTAFFDPRPELSDSLTYDITAWEMPYRYGLEGYALKDRLVGGNLLTAQDFTTSEGPVVVAEGGPAVRSTPLGDEVSAQERPYAYLLRWNSMEDARFLGDWFEAGGQIQVAMNPFWIGENEFRQGTIVITREGNPSMGEEFDTTLRELAAQHGRTVFATSSGAVTRGSDFGARSHAFVKAPRIAVLSREGTSSLSLGEIWHFMEEQLGYPATLIPTEMFNPASLQDYDVLVMPSGTYRQFRGSNLEAIQTWVRGGGRLVAMGDAVGYLAGKEGFAVKEKTADEDGNSNGGSGSGNGDDKDPLEVRYENRTRAWAVYNNPGSIYRARLDNSHPLAFGYDNQTFMLNIAETAYEPLENGTVGMFDADAHLSGHIGSKAKKAFSGSMAIGRQNMGAGSVTYMPVNLLFRGFWDDSKLMFVNSLFMGEL